VSIPREPGPRTIDRLASPFIAGRIVRARHRDGRRTLSPSCCSELNKDRLLGARRPSCGKSFNFIGARAAALAELLQVTSCDGSRRR
jgi:hypothetical protein